MPGVVQIPENRTSLVATPAVANGQPSSVGIFVRQIHESLLVAVAIIAKLHCFDLMWICCGLVVQLVLQQIHNKSNKWSLTLKHQPVLQSYKSTSPRRLRLFLSCTISRCFISPSKEPPKLRCLNRNFRPAVSVWLLSSLWQQMCPIVFVILRIHIFKF